MHGVECWSCLRIVNVKSTRSVCSHTSLTGKREWEKYDLRPTHPTLALFSAPFICVSGELMSSTCSQWRLQHLVTESKKRIDFGGGKGRHAWVRREDCLRRGRAGRQLSRRARKQRLEGGSMMVLTVKQSRQQNRWGRKNSSQLHNLRKRPAVCVALSVFIQL